MPVRRFNNLEEFKNVVTEAEELIFDGTENPTERPKDNERQRAKYSGKKKTHTDISLILSDKRTKIYYVSEYYDGKNVDFGILKQEFPNDKNWFKDFKVIVDLGFQGIASLYKIKDLIIGEKKPRKSKENPEPKLTPEQKTKNTCVSKQRIYVEHAIGRMKKYRMLKNRSRLKSKKLKNRILGIAAGLWNYYLGVSI